MSKKLCQIIQFKGIECTISEAREKKDANFVSRFYQSKIASDL